MTSKREANINDKLETAISKGLAKLGTDLAADRVVVMEGEGQYAKNTYSWTLPGLASAQKEQQKIDVATLKVKLQEQLNHDSLFLTDQAEIAKRFPEIVATYDSDYQLENVLLAPFYESGRVSGAVVVEDLDASLNMDFNNLIELTADFVGAKVMGRKLEQQRDTDVLTKLNDRHPYLAKLNYYKKVKASRSIGVAFMDLNGLKEANDELDHDAGDELLISAGQIISQAFGRDYVYRVGGDEFVVRAARRNSKVIVLRLRKL